MRSVGCALVLSWLAALSVVAPPIGARAQEQEQEQESESVDPARAEAQARFEEGVAAFRDGRPADARRSFAASLSLYQTPVTAWNLAQSMLSLGDPLEALAVVGAMLDQEYGPLDEEQRRAATDLRTEIHASLGLLRLRSAEAEPLELTIDATAVGTLTARGRLEQRVAPGVHVVRATARDARQVSERVTVAAGETADVHLVLPPVELTEPVDDGSVLSEPAFWVTAGAVVAVGAAIAVILLVTSGDDGEVDPVWGNIIALRPAP